MSNAATNAIGWAAIITVPAGDGQPEPGLARQTSHPPEKRVTRTVYDPRISGIFPLAAEQWGNGYVRGPVSRYPNEIPSASPPEKLDPTPVVDPGMDIYINALIDMSQKLAYPLRDNDVRAIPRRHGPLYRHGQQPGREGQEQARLEPQHHRGSHPHAT